MPLRLPAEPAAVGAVFADWSRTVTAEAAEARTVVVRSGDRAPIAEGLRRLVHRRDRWRCQWCQWSPFGLHFATTGPRPTMLQLDHIVPWSAGGSDRSDNLRTLCDACNEERSNRRTDVDLATVLPITNVCVPCDRALAERAADQRGDNGIDVYCGWGSHNSWVDSPAYLV